MVSFSFLRVLLALWAMVMVAAVAQASGGRSLLAVPDCPKGTGEVCPHNGKKYYYCEAGEADGGCRPQAQDPFPNVDCRKQCVFQSN